MTGALAPKPQEEGSEWQEHPTLSKSVGNIRICLIMSKIAKWRECHFRCRLPDFMDQKIAWETPVRVVLNLALHAILL